MLPVYYSDNYISLLPNETRTVTIEAALKDFNGEDALVVFDGWNVSVAPATFAGAAVAPNIDAQPDHWPTTGCRSRPPGCDSILFLKFHAVKHNEEIPVRLTTPNTEKRLGPR